MYKTESECIVTYDKSEDIFYLTEDSHHVSYKMKLTDNILMVYDMDSNSTEYTKFE